MAKQEETVEAADAPKGGKKKLIVILLIVLVVLIGGGAAAFLMLTAPAKEGEHAEKVEAEEHPPIYEKLESFTVNLADQETYLQVEIHLLVSDPTVQEKMKLRMPEVRDSMIRLLSSKMPEELASQPGKDALGGEVQKQINALLGITAEGQGVKKVLFNAFIIQ